MKAVWFNESGAAEAVLKIGEMPTPEPGPDDVLVRLHASGINPSDVKKRAGAQPAGFEDGFVIPHSDGAGIVAAVGDKVSSVSVGQRVWVYQAQYQRHQGTAAEYVVLPQSRVVLLPDEASFAAGACAGIPMMTAHRCIFADGPVAEKTVLVTGASGRVGHYAVQWAKQSGATVIATAGSAARCEQAASSGADHVLNYTETGLADQIMEITRGEGVDRVVDVEFGRNIETSSQILKTNGVIASYSSSKEMQPAIPFYPLMFKNITLQLVLVYNMPEAAKRDAARDNTTALKEERLQHRIASSYALEDTAKAHQQIEAGSVNGSVVLTF